LASHTRDFLPEGIGRDGQIEETTKAVEAAMRDARIDAVSDVHFVQIKCPLLTVERVTDAVQRGEATVTASGYASMGYSRGASAIGSVASCSAGIDLMHNVVILIGNSRFSSSLFRIGHAVMRDAIDLPAVIQAFASVGLSVLDAQSQTSSTSSPRPKPPPRRHTRPSSRHARRFGHQRHAPCPCGGRRVDWRRRGNRRPSTSPAALSIRDRRRPGRGHHACVS
jgi:hypothetical protein